MVDGEGLELCRVESFFLFGDRRVREASSSSSNDQCLFLYAHLWPPRQDRRDDPVLGELYPRGLPDARALLRGRLADVEAEPEFFVSRFLVFIFFDRGQNCEEALFCSFSRSVSKRLCLRDRVCARERERERAQKETEEKGAGDGTSEAGINQPPTLSRSVAPQILLSHLSAAASHRGSGMPPRRQRRCTACATGRTDLSFPIFKKGLRENVDTERESEDDFDF